MDEETLAKLIFDTIHHHLEVEKILIDESVIMIKIGGRHFQIHVIDEEQVDDVLKAHEGHGPS
jgi:predicted xylose isomerase-like sugar epimerase